jgi:iron complex outermembrane receptor protein
VSAASKYEQSARNAPAAVTIVTAEEIQRFGYRTISDVLETVPGFYPNNDLEVPSTGVRGFGRPGDYNSRMLVLLDGHPVNESGTNWALTDVRLGIDIDLVKRVEIVRGPGSALYGTGAMLAVVNIVTKNADDFEGLSLSGAAGSYGYREGRLATGKSFAKDRGLTAAIAWGHGDGRSIYFKDIDRPDMNGGIAERQDWKDYLNLSLRGQVGAVVVRGTHISYTAGDPAGSIRTAFNDDTAHQAYEIGRLEALYRRTIGTSKHVSMGAHLNRAARSQTMPFLTQDGIVVTDDNGESTWSGLAGEFQWDVSPVHRVVTGGEVKTASLHYRKWTDEAQLDEKLLRFSVGSAFVQDEYSLTRRLTTTAGVRYDYYSQAGGAVSPRIGIVFNPTRGTTVKALYGHAFRSPSAVELHWKEEEINFIPNPDLKPERMRTLELVWEQQLADHTVSSASIYRYNMHEIIDITFEGATRTIQFQNMDHVDAIGAEIALRTRTRSGLLAYSNYSYQHARHHESEERLVSSPDHLLKGGVSVPVPHLLSGGVEARFESNRLTVFRTLTHSHVLVDVFVQTKPFFSGHAEASARLLNALDTRYALPGNFDHRQLALTQPGRRFVVEVQYRF